MDFATIGKIDFPVCICVSRNRLRFSSKSNSAECVARGEWTASRNHGATSRDDSMRLSRSRMCRIRSRDLAFLNSILHAEFARAWDKVSPSDTRRLSRWKNTNPKRGMSVILLFRSEGDFAQRSAIPRSSKKLRMHPRSRAALMNVTVDKFHEL